MIEDVYEIHWALDRLPTEDCLAEGETWEQDAVVAPPRHASITNYPTVSRGGLKFTCMFMDRTLSNEIGMRFLHTCSTDIIDEIRMAIGQPLPHQPYSVVPLDITEKEKSKIREVVATRYYNFSTSAKYGCFKPGFLDDPNAPPNVTDASKMQELICLFSFWWYEVRSLFVFVTVLLILIIVSGYYVYQRKIKKASPESITNQFDASMENSGGGGGIPGMGMVKNFFAKLF